MNTHAHQKRNGSEHKFIRLGLWFLAAISIPATMIPFIRSWLPSAATKLSEAPLQVDISQMQPGQMLTVVWQGKPVWIIKRNSEMLNSLKNNESELKDPTSQSSQQPTVAHNRYRSVNKDFFVVLGKCTHLGCIPHLKAGEGIFCPCHGSKFDFAGRVLKGSPATKNLMVPRYHFSADGRSIIIG
jgi:ubiquinol-cytochrome c reductase iron-sulfur subunit